MTYKVSVIVDIDDEDKLGEAAVAKLKAGGKSDSEAKEMVYDSDLVQPLKALPVMTDYWTGWAGCTINKTEIEDI
jgi:hypothetical protein|tara:strand:- start:15837 stop:16061 length:225 start_codon:yes stop_codon:yes gene_type:complete